MSFSKVFQALIFGYFSFFFGALPSYALDCNSNGIDDSIDVTNQFITEGIVIDSPSVSLTSIDNFSPFTFSENLELSQVADFDGDSLPDDLVFSGDGIILSNLSGSDSKLQTQVHNKFEYANSACNTPGSTFSGCQSQSETVLWSNLNRSGDFNLDGLVDIQLIFFIDRQRVNFGVPSFDEFGGLYFLTALGTGNGTFDTVIDFMPFSNLASNLRNETTVQAAFYDYDEDGQLEIIFKDTEESGEEILLGAIDFEESVRSEDLNSNGVPDECDIVDSASYSIWSSFLNMVNVLEVVNPNESAATANLSYFYNPIDPINFLNGRSGGKSLIDTIPREGQSIVIPGLSQQDIILNESEIVSTDRIGYVALDNSSSDLIARQMTYRIKESGEVDFLFPMTLSKAVTGETSVGYNTFTSDLREGPTINWLSIANPTERVLAFKIEFYKTRGDLTTGSLIEKVISTNPVTGQTTFGTTSSRVTYLSVPPLGTRFIDAGHFLGENQVGLIIIKPQSLSSPYVAQLSRYSTLIENNVITSYPFVTSQIAKKPTTESQFLSISKGAGATNWVEISNPSNRDSTLDVKIFDGENSQENLTYKLGPKQQVHINASSYLKNSISGYVEIIPQGPSDAYTANGFVYFPRDAANPFVETTSSYINQGQSLSGSKFSVSYNTFLKMANWLRLSNPSSDMLVVNVSSTSSLGKEERDFSVAPHSSIDIGFIANAVSSGPVFGVAENEYGVVEISSNENQKFFGELIRTIYDDDLSVSAAAAIPLLKLEE